MAAVGRIAAPPLLERQVLGQVAVRLKWEQAAHEAATGSALCRAVSHFPRAAFLRPQESWECESSLFSVRLVRSSSENDYKEVCAGKTLLSRVKYALQKFPLEAVDSGEQIVAAASHDCAPNKLANGGFFR
jgi:hypothetical protein